MKGLKELFGFPQSPTVAGFNRRKVWHNVFLCFQLFYPCHILLYCLDICFVIDEHEIPSVRITPTSSLLFTPIFCACVLVKVIWIIRYLKVLISVSDWMSKRRRRQWLRRRKTAYHPCPLKTQMGPLTVGCAEKAVLKQHFSLVVTPSLALAVQFISASALPAMWVISNSNLWIILSGGQTSGNSCHRFIDQKYISTKRILFINCIIQLEVFLMSFWTINLWQEFPDDWPVPHSETVHPEQLNTAKT